MADARYAWQRAQTPVQPKQAVHSNGDVKSCRNVGNFNGTFADHLVGLSLDLGSSAAYERAADQEEDHQTENRSHHNEEQPGNRGRWATVARNRTERHDLDDQFDEVQDHRGPNNRVHRYHLLILIVGSRAPAAGLDRPPSRSTAAACHGPGRWSITRNR